MRTILIADDNADLRLLVKKQLSEQGYTVLTANDGAQAVQVGTQEPIDMAILDVMMPKKDGFAVTKVIRTQKKELPILILTAKSDIFDKQQGYEAGADDYLTKPFDIRELLFKMQALFRRYQGDTQTKLTVGDLVLDINNYSLTKGDQELFLPRKEFEVLESLAQHPNQIFNRDQLLTNIWGADYEGSDRTVDVHIKRLRDHLADDQTVRIVTVRGLGYRLEVQG
ncbi:response regulator transcription factor [Lactobacillus sp. CC-MHH1034]|uniref:response regulator transcription factor n=1 Tax=Agrilactobacillus fermenti TaxID=2586909 RepID=UPI001E5F9D5D|nr:response regulator transcription factor [Agrilactobacillus fermenti]MCD2255887.1 response regulator transcription factor [Agrilactobacillus fermenti]